MQCPQCTTELSTAGACWRCGYPNHQDLSGLNESPVIENDFYCPVCSRARNVALSVGEGNLVRHCQNCGALFKPLN